MWHTLGVLNDQLEVLDLGGNRLTALNNVPHLPQLRRLTLNYNPLANTPLTDSELESLASSVPKLENLQLSAFVPGQALDTVPAKLLEYFPHVRFYNGLPVGANALTGEMPLEKLKDVESMVKAEVERGQRMRDRASAEADKPYERSEAAIAECLDYPRANTSSRQCHKTTISAGDQWVRARGDQV